MKKLGLIVAALVFLVAGCAYITQPIVAFFGASPDIITAGGTTTLTWNVTSAQAVTINPGIGSVATAGSRTLSPTTTTTYTLTATNAAGAATANTVITVNVPASAPTPTPTPAPTPTPVPNPTEPPPVVNSFYANPNVVNPGGSTTLYWTTTGGSSATLNPGFGNVDVNGSRSVSPSTTTTYTLTVVNNAGSTFANATVTINAPMQPPVINSFTANPNFIATGMMSVLQWNVTGANQVMISNGVGTVPAVGSRSVTPGYSVTYTLTATNDAGSVTQSVTLNVYSGGGGY
jgi:hypothetical protein